MIDFFTEAEPGATEELEETVEFDTEDLADQAKEMGASILRRIREDSEAISGPELVLNDTEAQQMLIGVSN